MYFPAPYFAQNAYQFSSNDYNGHNYSTKSYETGFGHALTNYAPITSYSKNDNYALHQYEHGKKEEAHSSILIENYLEENRPWTPVISQLGEVKEIINEAFKTITNHEFPHDCIRIVICTKDDLKKIHSSIDGSWSEGIMGFSLNRFGKGISEIYVRAEHMDSLLLTIGHEIGHVLSPTLPSIQDEEAKAHAFSIAWMETIRDNNIGDLKPNIRLNPAKNGIHDVGYDFVKYLMQAGSSALDVYRTLSTGLASILARVEA